MFDVFDRPDANASCARRHESTTAPQSLTLLNSTFSLDMARRLAGRALDESDRMEKQIEFCYELALGRPPTISEREESIAFLGVQTLALETGSRSVDSLARPIPEPTQSEPFADAALA